MEVIYIDRSKKWKILVLFILLIIYTVLIWYFKYYIEIQTVYTQLFYIPIGLTAIWWGTKSVWTAVYLGFCLNIANYILLRTVLQDDILRFLMFTLFAYIIGVICAKYEKRLCESQQQMADIINFLPDATFAIDLEGKVISWNQAIEEMTGICAKDMLGKGEYEYAIPFYGKRRPILIDLVLHSFEEIKQEYHFIQRDSKCLVAETITPNIYETGAFMWGKATSLYDSKGNIVGAIESIRDITIRKRMEQESIKNSKLESISVLAGGIAHDFNNFLAVILGNIALLKKIINPQDKKARLLSEAEKAAFQATNLTHQLLTFSKGGTPIKEIINLSQILEDAISLALSGSTAKCKINISENLWYVQADKGQIYQVINNLIINAYQSMPNGGTIYLSCKNTVIEKTELIPLEPGKYVRISIKDEGIGIVEENILKIFDPYFTTKQHGHGLGLATSYSIINRHGGHISVESKVGKGTTFDIYLPAYLEKGIQFTSQDNALLYGRGKILVMDDDVKIRSLLGEILEYLGYKSELASEGLEAINLFIKAKDAGEPFDGIIMDLTIPGGLGGKDTIKKLKTIDPNVKVIVSSGYSNDPVMADFTAYGFVGVIPKPYTIEKLSNVLKTIIGENEKATSEKVI